MVAFFLGGDGDGGAEGLHEMLDRQAREKEHMEQVR